MRGLRLQLLALLMGACAFAAGKIEILRDRYGIPHIYARTAPEAAFGSGYAEAADRSAQLIENLKNAPRPAAPAALSDGMRAIVQAYCAGVNSYFAERGASERVDPSMVEGFSRTAFGLFPDSNDILIAPSRSRDRAPIAILAPMGAWSGESRVYPMDFEISSGGPNQDRFEFAGAAPAGVPFPLMGHSAAVAIAPRGRGLAGDRALDQAFAMISSKNLVDAKRALAMAQFPAQKFLIADAEGEIYDSRTQAANPPEGILLSGGGAFQAAAMTRQLSGDARTFSLESAESLALATDVYKAETWQLRIAHLGLDSDFVRMLTGWSRRADATSRGALAFYLFKMALGDDSAALGPPASLSDNRVRAALRKAQDRLETEFPVDAGWGALFRIIRDGARRSWPVGGGTVTQAGMATPRAIDFEKPGTLMVAQAGLAMLEVVEFSKPVRSAIMTPLGESDSPDSPHFDDQARELFSQSLAAPTWFGDRKNLEKHSKDRKELTYP